jgi:protein SCO1/2
MTRILSLHSVRAVVTGFAVAAVITLSVGDIGESLTSAARVVSSQMRSPAAPSGLRATSTDFPDVAIETSQGVRTTFAATGGHVRIATMFFAHCPGVCPLTIDTLRGIDRQLAPAQRAKLSFVLLSLDPERDSPGVLRAILSQHQIDSSRWLVGRTSAADARAFAQASRINYRKLADGSIDHSSSLVLLDAQGRVLARNSDTGNPDPQFIAAVRRALSERHRG